MAEIIDLALSQDYNKTINGCFIVHINVKTLRTSIVFLSEFFCIVLTAALVMNVAEVLLTLC